MLYALQSAQFSPVYYPNAWYVVYHVRLKMECIRDCSMLYALQSALSTTPMHGMLFTMPDLMDASGTVPCHNNVIIIMHYKVFNV